MCASHSRPSAHEVAPQIGNWVAWEDLLEFDGREKMREERRKERGCRKEGGQQDGTEDRKDEHTCASWCVVGELVFRVSGIGFKVWGVGLVI